MRELSFKTMRFKNFLRFGEKFTEIDFSGLDGLSVIMGENGRGKSTIFDAFSFVTTGKPVRKLMPGKLVNNFNKKNMVVILDLEKGDEEARIIRGQKPGLVKFYVKPKGDERDIEKFEEFDRTLPSPSETSKEIEKYLGFDTDLLRFTIINSTRVPTFFQSDSSVQKAVTESLFTFNLLSDVAEKSKLIRQKLNVSCETEMARLMERKVGFENYQGLLVSLEQRINDWESQNTNKINKLREEIEVLNEINFEEAEQLLVEVEEYEKEVSVLASNVRNFETTYNHHVSSKAKCETALTTLNMRRDELAKVDLEEAKARNEEISEVNRTIAEFDAVVNEIEKARLDLKKEIMKAQKKVDECKDINCPTCGQEWPDAESMKKNQELLEGELQSLTSDMELLNNSLEDAKSSRGEIVVPPVIMRESDIIRAESDIEGIDDQIKAATLAFEDASKEEMVTKEALENERLSLSEKMKEVEKVKERVQFSRKEISDLMATKAMNEKSLEKVLQETNPHMESLKELQNNIPEEPDFTAVDAMKKEIAHREFLESSLNRKDSPIRKVILSKYIPYLNDRMSHYLKALGLPYTVVFNDDLSADIDDFGESVDPGALSGGEEERVSMALNWAFRDVFEEINGIRIKFSGIDERLDSGLDAGGAVDSMGILTEMCLKRGRNIAVVTHKNELEEYADRTIRVTREGRFSQIEIENNARTA